MISFIVSVLDRPHFLNACLASLAVQEGPKDIIVCANSKDQGVLTQIEAVCLDYDVQMEDTGIAGATTCYESANMVAGKALGDWLCFPSDDSLYVCKFSEIMLSVDADLVYCDCVYRGGETAAPYWKQYSVLGTQPRIGKIDKTCFIVRRNLFKGFPAHLRNWSDGALIEDLVKQGVRHAKAPGVLVVHQ